jgi:hypothetical protein
MDLILIILILLLLFGGGFGYRRYGHRGGIGIGGLAADPGPLFELRAQQALTSRCWPASRSKALTGRSRLPGGEPRKASQRNKRNVASSGAAKLTPVWRASMPVIWKGRAGIFRREIGDGDHAEILIDGRIYRVRISELR